MHTHAHTTVTQGEVEQGEVLSLYAGVVLVIDADVLTFIAQLSLITQARLRLSLLCVAQCMFKLKTSALQRSIITLNFSQTSSLVLDDILFTSWYSPLANLPSRHPF